MLNSTWWQIREASLYLHALLRHSWYRDCHMAKTGWHPGHHFITGPIGDKHRDKQPFALGNFEFPIHFTYIRFWKRLEFFVLDTCDCSASWLCSLKRLMKVSLSCYGPIYILRSQWKMLPFIHFQMVVIFFIYFLSVVRKNILQVFELYVTLFKHQRKKIVNRTNWEQIFVRCSLTGTQVKVVMNKK